MKTARLQPTLFSYMMDMVLTWNNELIGFIQTNNTSNVTSKGFNLLNLSTCILARTIKKVKTTVKLISKFIKGSES